jgi:hypothetical protein
MDRAWKRGPAACAKDRPIVREARHHRAARALRDRGWRKMPADWRKRAAII